MDTVLGVSMAPTTVRVVLVEGENADGATVDEDHIAVAGDQDPQHSAGQIRWCRRFLAPARAPTRPATHCGRPV